MSKKTDAVPNWRRGRKPLYAWIRVGLHERLKKESKLREISMRKIVSEVLERAIEQL